MKKLSSLASVPSQSYGEGVMAPTIRMLSSVLELRYEISLSKGKGVEENLVCFNEDGGNR